MMPTPPQEQEPTPSTPDQQGNFTFPLIGFALTALFIVGFLLVNSEITEFEETGGTLSMHVFFMMLYDLGGKNLVLGFLAVFAVMFFYFGVSELVSLIRKKR